MANRRFEQFFYTLHKKPVLLDCNFIVETANSSGKGITPSSLVGPGIQAVYMNSTAAFTGTTHTSTLVDSISSTANLAVGMLVSGSGITAGTTIAAINSSVAITLSAATSSSTTTSITYAAVGSPNPPAGHILVQLQDCYSRYYGGFDQINAPNSGSALTSTTAGTAYVITALGTATLAQWLARGVPSGTTPAVGVAFVATTTGTIGGSAAVQTALVSTVNSIEVIGQPNTTIVSSAGQRAQILGLQSGAYLLMKCLGPTLTMNSYTPAGTNDGATPPIFTGTPATLTGTVTYAAKQPAEGSKIFLGMYLSSSSITVQGE